MLARVSDADGAIPVVVALSDVTTVRERLIAAARARRPVCYAELLADLGHRFTRPKMRALCRTLDAVDAVSHAAGEPDLAVLVVRQADGLPGQGWWTGGHPRAAPYDGPWTGRPARRFVRKLQESAFAFWASAPASNGTVGAGGSTVGPASAAQM